MVTTLKNCTKEEQRPAVSFLRAEGVPGGQIHQCMYARYGTMLSPVELCVSGLKCFKMAVKSVTDTEGSGCPTTATTGQNEEGSPTGSALDSSSRHARFERPGKWLS
jgi:hypothetical protein